MLDFARLTETISDFVSSFAGSAQEGPASLLDLISNAGLDPSALTGMSQDEILTLLSEHGIDPSALAEGQLDEFLANAGLDGVLPEDFFGSGDGNPPQS
jgi:hypothetical protein